MTVLPAQTHSLLARLPAAARRPLALAGVAALTAGVYGLGLLRPYNIVSLRLLPSISIASLTRNDAWAQAGFVAAFALLAGLYYLAWRLCRGSTAPAMWRVLLVSAALINLAMVWLYPVDAADLFDNIVRGRLTALHGGNPFYDRPDQFPADDFFAYSAWPRATTAYGPLWELIAAGTVRLSGHDRTSQFLAFKLLGVGFYAGCLGLIARILRRQVPERALQGVCLFALNPLVIYETAGNGHNDIVLAFCVLLAIDLLLTDHPALSGAALTAGILVKFAPALLLPPLLAAMLRAQPDWRARLRRLSLAAALSAILILAVTAPFYHGGDFLGLKRRETMFTTSLPAVVQAQLEASLGLEASRQWTMALAFGLTAAAVVASAWRAWAEARPARRESRDWLAPVRAANFVLLFYLLFTCLWFQPWYVIWPLALAALLPEGEAGRLVVLLSYTALWKSIVFNVLLYTGGPLPPRTWRERWLGPATLGLAWLYGAYAAARRLAANPRWRLVRD